MKLPLREPEHDAFLAELVEWDGYVSSALLAVEAIRACARYGPEFATQARSWLDGLALLPLDDAVLDVATSLGPAGLRSLDALHLATALSVRDEIGVLITYDRRLADTAEALGLRVAAPIA
ncbi:MAG: type II toxin-antitoxin system VapC family toxin [Thermoleophilia bacterium]|nr:type II toxin-antitoxin system VapC family toxin [Thermoleophilia bacterium]